MSDSTYWRNRMKITANQIISWGPCPMYPAALVRELVGDGVTIEEILETKKIPNADKAWMLTREEIFPAKQIHELACRFAEYALSKADNPDPRSVEAIRVKRLWIAGKATDEEMRKARVAAWSSAWSSAWSAAREAVWSAAWSDILKIIKDFIGEQNEDNR
jgi:hypothetical protein